MTQADIQRLYEAVGKRTKTALFWKIIGAVSVVGLLMIGGVHGLAVDRSTALKVDVEAAIKRAADTSFAVADNLSTHADRHAHEVAGNEIAVLKEQLGTTRQNLKDIKDGQNTIRRQQLETLRALDRLTTELRVRRGAAGPGSLEERLGRGGWPPPSPDG
jgi:5-bromo-4-chloroindolyl phosphate hydrolysis protein